MRFKNAASLFCLVFVGLISVGSIKAQGVIVPIVCDVRPCRPILLPRPIPIPNALPVKSIELDTKINGQVATTRVEQVFRNDTAYTLEGTYFFPIPETASIVEFAIWENGKKLVGEIRSREEARRIYDEIVRRQKDPGLLEYAGRDLFQASIFPIPPNSDKKLEIVYSQILKAESGTVAYRYPLGMGRNLWSRQNPAFENSNRNMPAQKIGTVSGKIEIVGGKDGIRNVYSPSHQIDVRGKGETGASVSFETTGNDNDFQLFYTLSNSDFGMSLLTYREPGKDGYFLLTLSPKDNLSERELVNKDIVFVLDTSGSMNEEGKMEKARAALLFGVRTLREGDHFNIINFAGEEHLMETSLIAANDSGKKRGEDFAGKLNATGGTNINDSLVAALKQFNASPRPKMLVFMTDGLPTVGEQNIERIVANVNKAKAEGIRLFTFGVGYDVNTQLLDRLAAENSGAADYVEPKENLEIKVSNFFTKVSSPVLSDLQIDFGSAEIDYIYPRRITDLFKGGQITLIGRYRNDRELQNTTLRLTGKSGTENRSFAYQNLDFPLRAEDNNFLPRLWATRRVGWILEQIRAGGETKELRDEVAELGTRYGIVTPYTSYLATDGSFESVRRDASGSFVMNDQAARSVREKSGKDAVKLSVQQNAQMSNATLAPSSRNVFVADGVNNQFVGTKNFYNQSGVWQDAEFKSEAKLAEVRIQFASREYFDLLNREKELAQFFALGEQVVVVWKGKVYRVTK